MSTSKFNLFLENARLLSDKFGIVPLLYGSLGLEHLTGEDLGADDIDILIPRVFITERWQEFKAVLEKQGYVLTDAHEHTFMLDGATYSYADIEDLESFASIRAEDMKMCEVNGVRFLFLSLEQYLAVYRRSSMDGYIVRGRNVPKVYATSIRAKDMTEASYRIRSSELFTEEQKNTALRILSSTFCMRLTRKND